MAKFQIITKAQPHKQKTLIYGLSGSGKTTLASQMEAPLFIDVEGGCGMLNVARTPVVPNYATGLMVLREIHAHPEDYTSYKTIVIDSIDWLCRKAEEHASGVKTVVDGQVIEDMSATIGKANGGYGNGGKQLENHIRAQLLPALDKLVEDGFGICLIAHADQKDMMDAEGVQVSKISPAIGERLMMPIVQWCDNVFYLKDIDGRRTLLLNSTSDILAKNRLAKSGEVDLSQTTIQEVLSIKEDK